MIIIKIKLKIKINKLTKNGSHEPCKHASHISHAKKILIDPVYLNGPKVRLSGPNVRLSGPKVRLSGPRVVPDGPSVSKSYPKKKQKKSKSKLGLPRVTIRDQIIPQPKSPR